MLDFKQVLSISKFLSKDDRILNFKLYKDGHLVVIISTGQKVVFTSKEVDQAIQSLKNPSKPKVINKPASKPATKSRGRPKKPPTSKK